MRILKEVTRKLFQYIENFSAHTKPVANSWEFQFLAKQDLTVIYASFVTVFARKLSLMVSSFSITTLIYLLLSNVEMFVHLKLVPDV